MHDIPAVRFDTAAAEAWLRQPHPHHTGDPNRWLGVDEALVHRETPGFLHSIETMLAAQPGGWHPRSDVTDVLLWPLAGDAAEQGALITVDLASGVRLASTYQPITGFAGRDQCGVAAVLSALAHIAGQASRLVTTWCDSRPVAPQRHEDPALATVTAATRSAPGVFTEQQVSEALNRAADDILDAVDAGDDGLRDGINLMVNATASYLTGRATDLPGVVAGNYDADYPHVLSWIRG